MRIAFVCHSFPAISETFIQRQITGMLDLGHEVDVFADVPASEKVMHASDLSYALRERAIYANVKGGLSGLVSAAFALVKSFVISPYAASYTFRRSFSPLAGPRTGVFLRLGSALNHRTRRYDAIHCHHGDVANNYLCLHKIFPAPLIVSFHGADFSAFPASHGTRVYEELFRTASLVTVNSDYTARKVLALGCPAAKVRKLPVGVDLKDFEFQPRFAPQSGKIRILTVGRLVEKKGLFYSIQACQLLRQRGLDIRYDILGDGPLRSSLEELIEKLNLKDSVVMHGAGNTTRVREYMRDAHLFVLASVTAENGDTEGQGLVLQEAQASGLPVVVTDHNGFSESIVPTKSGFLVPEKDVDALANTMQYVLTNPQMWAHMGLAGRRHVETSYDITALNRRLESIYKEACARRGEVISGGEQFV